MSDKQIKSDKTAIREKCKIFRKEITKKEKNQLDLELQSRFLTIPEYYNADTIFAYIAKDIEIETSGIIGAAFANNKRVAVPKCDPKNKTMDFYYITPKTKFETGAYNIKEPVLNSCVKVTNYNSGICLVPGLTFDAEGYRLGYGMGYYDRFLPKFKGDTVGFSYSSCMEWHLPCDKFDRSVDILITERYIRYLNKK